LHGGQQFCPRGIARRDSGQPSVTGLGSASLAYIDRRSRLDSSVEVLTCRSVTLER
jgi:hypothetical protein